jgi:hypothetical protein
MKHAATIRQVIGAASLTRATAADDGCGTRDEACRHRALVQLPTRCTPARECQRMAFLICRASMKCA